MQREAGNMTEILIVEDDKNINELIKRNLQLVGYVCSQCYSGTEALKKLYEKKYDLVLLDVMLPGISGFDLIPKLNDTPVIFVTAKGELEDKIKGLGLGAEDYIVKPFEMLELIARVGVVLRRKNRNEKVFELNGTRVNLEERTVMAGEKEVTLTPQEYNLLEILIQNKNIALSREKLLELAWGFDYKGETKTVDVHIQKLRKKLNWEKNIKTLVKMGYRLET